MPEMPQSDESQAFRRMIDALEEAASCARQLAFRRGQNLWLKVDEKIVQMRKLVIELYESSDKTGH
jgi:hypothetical protein